MPAHLLVVDVGNTNIVFGVYLGDRLAASFRLSTQREWTADDYAGTLLPLFAREGIDAGATEAVVVSSVVPRLGPTLRELAQRCFGHTPLFVEPGVRTGMPIRYENPAEVGADRIVNALAARERYGAPVVVVDFGTATTFDVVNPAGEYAGGIIAPGLGISAGALFSHASRLPQVDLRRPDRLVGRNTVHALQSGLYYGYVGLVDGILRRLKGEIEGLATVVATGGEAGLLAEGSQEITEVDPLLTLEGLRLIHERNR